MMPGPTQIIVVILLFMLIFGYKRIPDMMENLAKGINSFKKGMKEEDQSNANAKAKAVTDETVIDAKAVEEDSVKSEAKE